MIVFAWTAADHIGIIPRAIVHVFEGKEREEDRDTVYTVHVSYMEIYNEEIRDLLSGDQSKKLDIKGTHGVVAGTIESIIHSDTMRVCPPAKYCLQAYMGKGRVWCPYVDILS